MNSVYVQTNEAENRVVAFRREPDGSLTRTGDYATGGAGDSSPHLPSQGSVVLSGDGRHVLVTNAGSGDLSVFAVEGVALRLVGTAAAGAAPKSVAEHGGLVYALSTGERRLSGFRLGETGLEELPGSRRDLPEGADPAQAGFSPDGSLLVVSDRANDSLVVFPVGDDGLLGRPAVQASSGPTPYGFAFAGDALVVTEAFRAETGKAAASSYRLAGGTLAPVTRSLGNGRSEICWAVVTPDGRYAYTTNFADGAVSRYAIGPDADITLDDAAAGIAVDGQKGLRDEDVTGDGRFLYAIDADSQRIFGWSVGAQGELEPVGSWDGLPATVAGLAAA